jgi:anti-sigma B factor antagonist
MILLNLAEVPYMDAGGLSEVVRCYTTVKRAGGDYKLLNVSKRVIDIMTITKLISVFEIHEDEAAAIASFA